MQIPVHDGRELNHCEEACKAGVKGGRRGAAGAAPQQPCSPDPASIQPRRVIRQAWRTFECPSRALKSLDCPLPKCIVPLRAVEPDVGVEEVRQGQGCDHRPVLGRGVRDAGHAAQGSMRFGIRLVGSAGYGCSGARSCWSAGCAGGHWQHPPAKVSPRGPCIGQGGWGIPRRAWPCPRVPRSRPDSPPAHPDPHINLSPPPQPAAFRSDTVHAVIYRPCTVFMCRIPGSLVPGSR